MNLPIETGHRSELAILHSEDQRYKGHNRKELDWVVSSYHQTRQRQQP
ncbi:MAG: hypothetical protein V4629_14110 [Pseudomonadota bacterium]